MAEIKNENGLYSYQQDLIYKLKALPAGTFISLDHPTRCNSSFTIGHYIDEALICRRRVENLTYFTGDEVSKARPLAPVKKEKPKLPPLLKALLQRI